MANATHEDIKQVVLGARHEALGGRMVPFAGYALPVQYSMGIIGEHKWTRDHAGLFDVSHMGPCFLTLTIKSGDVEADHAAISALIEPLICGDIAGLKPGRTRYTLLLNDAGGILDDLMITRPASPEEASSLYIVVNAGTKENDFALIAKAAGDKAKLTRADDGALIALQGPEAVAALNDIVPGVADLTFMSCDNFPYEDTQLVITRSGYTGEDGCEILVPANKAVAFWDRLLEDDRIEPIGLGARDSLRLEAGLPLYGHDLDETISPIEAGVGFAVSKRRREAADFPGAQRILAEREGKLTRVRVGLHVAGAPAREGAEIVDADGNIVGVITSGGFSPCLGKAIALGFVSPELADVGRELGVVVRGRTNLAHVVETPFVAHNYYRKPA